MNLYNFWCTSDHTRCGAAHYVHSLQLQSHTSLRDSSSHILAARVLANAYTDQPIRHAIVESVARCSSTVSTSPAPRPCQHPRTLHTHTHTAHARTHARTHHTRHPGAHRTCKPSPSSLHTQAPSPSARALAILPVFVPIVCMRVCDSPARGVPSARGGGGGGRRPLACPLTSPCWSSSCRR